jgi:hypothetical protein
MKNFIYKIFLKLLRCHLASPTFRASALLIFCVPSPGTEADWKTEVEVKIYS